MKANVLANRDRAMLESLKARFQGKLIRQDYIRTEAVLDNNGLLSFTVRESSLRGQGRPLTKGVLDNDLFIGTELGLFLDSRVKAKPSAVRLQTAPVDKHFAESGATVQDLEAFYNAQLRFAVGGRVYLDKLDTNAFRRVGITQESIVGNVTSADTFNIINLLSDGSRDTNFVNLDPSVELSGKSDVELQIQIPIYAGIAMAATAGTHENVATVYFRGFTVVNAAQ